MQWLISNSGTQQSFFSSRQSSKAQLSLLDEGIEGMKVLPIPLPVFFSFLFFKIRVTVGQVFVIHKNKEVPEVQKCYNLLSALTREALKLLHSIPLSNKN